MTYLLKYFLRFLARIIIRKYKPKVVAITGSVGKTSAKEAIYAVLKNSRYTRKSAGNLNNELGIPLAIIADTEKERELKLVTRDGEGQGSALSRARFWARIIFKGIWLICARARYPEVLILEYGADRPGDIQYLLAIASPSIAVVTAVGDIPAHVEFYTGKDAVAEEKSKLVGQTPSDGFAVLNIDDATVYAMREKTRGRVITFGFNENASVQIMNASHAMSGGIPHGVEITLKYQKSTATVILKGSLGKVSAYAASAATCVGLIFDLGLDEIAANLSAHYVSPKQRMSLKAGIKRSFIIDDSYNASPSSMRAALLTLKDIPAKRKVAILGDMLEIGVYSQEAHETAGRLAAHCADVLITVGARAKFIADAARQAGMSAENIISVMTAEEAGMKAQNLISEGDLILIKASRALYLEKTIEEIEKK